VQQQHGLGSPLRRRNDELEIDIS